MGFHTRVGASDRGGPQVLQPRRRGTYQHNLALQAGGRKAAFQNIGRSDIAERATARPTWPTVGHQGGKLPIHRQQHGAAILVQFNPLHRRQGCVVAAGRITRTHFGHAQHHAEYSQCQGFVILPLVLGQQGECPNHPIVVSHRIEEPGHRHGLRQLRNVAAVSVPEGGLQALAVQLGGVQSGGRQRAMRLAIAIAGEVVAQHGVLALQGSRKLCIKIQCGGQLRQCRDKILLFAQRPGR